MDPSCPAFSSATNATALSYAASFHVTDAENFKFLSARSRVQGKKLVIIPKPIEIAFVASKWIFFFFTAGCWIDRKAAAQPQTKAKINKRP